VKQKKRYDEDAKLYGNKKRHYDPHEAAAVTKKGHQSSCRQYRPLQPKLP